MTDFSRYIGLPYRVEGRGPSHYDCWGLVQLVYRDHLGIELPANTGYSETMTPETACLIDDGKDGWIEVGQPQPFDVVILNVNGIPNHIGIVIGPAQMLHTTGKTNACIENFRRPVWARRLNGFFRHADTGSPPASAA